MSVTLLWALLLNGQEVVAYSCVPQNPQQQTASQVNKASQEEKTVVKQKVSLEATTSFVALNLQPALQPLPQPAFAAPADEQLPAFTAVPPGTSPTARLFPVTIQPQAP